jgi:hypothetical protein
MPGQAKDLAWGNDVTCCGLPFSNIAEVQNNGPKWREIKTAVIRKMLTMSSERRRQRTLVKLSWFTVHVYWLRPTP